jgi:hypothetical protein
VSKGRQRLVVMVGSSYLPHCEVYEGVVSHDHT